MPRTVATPSVAFSPARIPDVETDLLIVPVFDGENIPAAIEGLDGATGGAVQRAESSREIQGRLFEFFATPTLDGYRAARVALAGAGRAAEFTTERLRRVATAAALAARQRRVPRIAFVMRGAFAPELAVQAAAEGLLLAAFSADRYKSGERGGAPAEQALVVLPGGGPRLEEAVERGRILGESCNIARDLCNEPSNVLTPSVFAERAAAIADSMLG